MKTKKELQAEEREQHMVRATISALFATLISDADLRTRNPIWKDIASNIYIHQTKEEN